MTNLQEEFLASVATSLGQTLKEKSDDFDLTESILNSLDKHTERPTDKQNLSWETLVRKNKMADLP